MKKLLVTIIGLAAGASLVHAQGGLISFFNSTANIQTNTTAYSIGYPATTGGTAGKIQTQPAGGLFYFALLTAATTNAQDLGNPLGTDWSVVNYNSTGAAALGTNSQSALFVGGATGAGQATGFATSLTAGTSYFTLVVGWSSIEGSSWTTILSELQGNNLVSGGYFGYSNVGTIIPTSGTANGASVFGGSGAQPGQTILYQVTGVPEPTTLALAGLGGLSVLFLRRRKA
jgi:hypothetical protein